MLQGNKFCSASQCAGSRNFFNNPIQLCRSSLSMPVLEFHMGPALALPKALGTINQLQ